MYLFWPGASRVITMLTATEITDLRTWVPNLNDKIMVIKSPRQSNFIPYIFRQGLTQYEPKNQEP